MNLALLSMTPSLSMAMDEKTIFEITIRDMFAMSALASLSLHSSNGNLDGMPVAIANTAYRIADAMIAEKHRVSESSSANKQ